MAKKAESVAMFNTLMSEIRAGRFAPVYLLMGEEPYFIDALTEVLRARVVPTAEARDFDMDIFFANDTQIDDVAGAARQFPLMGEKKLVMLKELQSMQNGKNNLAKIAPIAAKPMSSTVLVVTFKGEPLGATHEFVKAVKKGGGVIFTSSKLKEWELNAHITDYCKERKINIDRRAVEMLKEYVGADLSRLATDIDKLIVAGGGAPITPELIEKNIGFSKDFNVFELVNALSVRDYVRCMRIVDYFERNPKDNPVIKTVALLFRFFSHLMIAHFSREKSDAALMAQLGYRSTYQLKDIKPALKNYSAMSVFRIIHALRKLDAQSKGIGSMQKDYSLLRQFVYEAFTL